VLEGNRTTRSLGVSLAVGLALVLGSCKEGKNPTGPGGTLSGTITLAAGQVGDVRATSVTVYLTDPFAANPIALQTDTASGTPDTARYSFSIAHGDFYVVAWKDVNLDHIVDSGDLYGWYADSVDAGGHPVAAYLHVVHGQSIVENVTVSVKP